MKSTAAQRGALFLAAFVLLPTLAHAHPGGHAAGFSHGFLHPLGGLDHLCAMIAVGLWAAQLGGRAIWAVPAAFVSAMALGGALGMAHIGLPFMETGIVLSVLTLGVLVAASARLPLAVSVALVGVFALFHGQAHGEEMPATASGLTYALGFIFSTALLHVAGIGLGVAIQKAAKPVVVRFAGGAIALCGLALLLS